MKVAMVGATKGMGRALARLLAENGHALFLLGRNEEDLEKSVTDLTNRSQGIKAGHHRIDLEDPSSFPAAVDAADSFLDSFDTVVITAGLFDTQERLEADPERMQTLLNVNFTNTILLCEQFRRRLLSRGGGRLCVFSSVAGDRGRKPTGIYGASKAGLSYYLESLDHRYHSEGLTTICVKPGFVKTGMTAGIDPPPFAGEPDAVAKGVYRALQKGTPVVYTPFPWCWIMMVIRNLPRFVMRKINF